MKVELLNSGYLLMMSMLMKIQLNYFLLHNKIVNSKIGKIRARLIRKRFSNSNSAKNSESKYISIYATGIKKDIYKKKLSPTIFKKLKKMVSD